MVVRREKRPSFADDPVFIYTSQWTAVFCTQEPKKERKCPKRKSLKFLILKTSKGIFYSSSLQKFNLGLSCPSRNFKGGSVSCLEVR
jgi:hypothetical protein